MASWSTVWTRFQDSILVKEHFFPTDGISEGHWSAVCRMGRDGLDVGNEESGPGLGWGYSRASSGSGGESGESWVGTVYWWSEEFGSDSSIKREFSVSSRVGECQEERGNLLWMVGWHHQSREWEKDSTEPGWRDMRTRRSILQMPPYFGPESAGNSTGSTGRMERAVCGLAALWVPRCDWNQPSPSFCCCFLPWLASWGEEGEQSCKFLQWVI
jgi:hypothetical protein